MKQLLWGIYILFIGAMVIGVWISLRSAEGLVDGNYYEKGNAWFSAKSDEANLGFELSGPEKLKTGRNRLTIALRAHGQPLSGARVDVFLGRVPSTAYDRTVSLKETSPGLYEADIELPAGGKWILRTDLSTGQLRTERSWFIDVD